MTKWTTAPNARLNLLRKNICVMNVTNHTMNGLQSYPHQNKTTISGTRYMRVKYERLHMDNPVTRSGTICHTGRLTCVGNTNL